MVYVALLRGINVGGKKNRYEKFEEDLSPVRSGIGGDLY